MDTLLPYKSVKHLHAVPMGDQKRVTDPLRVELQTVVNLESNPGPLED